MNALARGGIRLIEGLLVVLLGLMVVLVFGNVVLRYGFNSGLVFSEEVSRFIFMWLTLLGALVALHDGAHLGVDSLVQRLPAWGRRGCRFLSDLLMLGCCVLLGHGTWKQVSLAMSDRSPVTGVPMGLVFSVLLVCAAGMTWVLLHSLWRHLRGRMSDEELLRGSAAASSD